VKELPSHPTLTNLLERARRRLFGQLAIDKGALALVIGMAAVILLLLAGTQILDWYWPVLVVAVSLGVGIYRLRKSLPSLYVLAQRIDKRLGLADSLSTAVHFAAHPEPERQAVCEVQRREAEIVAQRVDLQRALPPSRSRYLLPAAGLALVAFGLFAVRYAVTGSLSLEPSLLKIAYDSFFGPPPQLAKNQAKRLNMKQDPFDPGNPDAQSTATDQQPQDLLNAQDSNDAANPQGDDNAKQAADKDGDKNGGDKNGGDAEKQGKDQGDDKSGKQGDKGDQGSKDGKDAQNKEGGNQDKQGNNPSEGGVLDKIKDALANMLNKMKPNTAQPPQQNAKNQASKDKGEKSDKGEKADKQPDSQNGEAESNPDSNQSGDQKNAEDAKNSSQPGKPSQQDSASGAGSKDGDKAAKDAKALEAMGQISEIIGKRSAAVTGEMMVEVGQTKQSLKTPWADRQTSHTEAGGEIHRDEVPLMFQPFVERYFEEIRKTPQAAKPAAKSK
jgi:hypothetical protein